MLGRRFNSTTIKENKGTKVVDCEIGKKNNKHRDLCLIAAKWLRKASWHVPGCNYVAVELVSSAQESPDVFGWAGGQTVIIEVKVSRSDFLSDAKKIFREKPEEGAGMYRYYCCPQGLIKEEELPKSWGLLYLQGNDIKIIKGAMWQISNGQTELIFLSSIIRREGIKPQIFDYRNKTIKK